MLGLDLFSGIGGITKALDGYVQPVAYCENDRYAQAVLLSRMSKRELPVAPIWDDVRTLRGDSLRLRVDIVYGGFPCQDISCAGRGAGLGGKRSGLFFEIVRLVSEIRPKFVFLENVPAIRSRGGDIVVGELAGLGYDCRWDVLSARDVGANHRRERWWLLAHADSKRQRQPTEQADFCGDRGATRMEPDVRDTGCELPGTKQDVAYADGIDKWTREELRKQKGNPSREFTSYGGNPVADSHCPRGSTAGGTRPRRSEPGNGGWWDVEPDVGRVANGIPKRVDRLRALGNAVVPAQAREAFERLLGLK